MGSTCVARHAGMKHAVRATTHSRTETVENVSTSVDVSVAPGVVLLHLSADYERVIDCLRSNRSLRDVPRHPVVVADRQLPDGRIEVLQLSPLSAALIELCDSVRTVRDIATLFPRLGEGLERFPPEPACRFALHELAEQGMLVFSPTTD